MVPKRGLKSWCWGKCFKVPSCKHDTIMAIMKSQLFCLLALCLHTLSTLSSQLSRKKGLISWCYLLMKYWQIADSESTENIVLSFVAPLTPSGYDTIRDNYLIRFKCRKSQIFLPLLIVLPQQYSLYSFCTADMFPIDGWLSEHFCLPQSSLPPL